MIRTGKEKEDNNLLINNIYKLHSSYYKGPSMLHKQFEGGVA